MKSQDQAELARALFEESGDAMFLLEPETDQLVDVNSVAVRLTGFTQIAADNQISHAVANEMDLVDSFQAVDHAGQSFRMVIE